MLTDSERAWLKKKERILREGKVWGAWCYACPNFGRDWAECYAHQYCPIFNSHEALQEAAEFESRVAARLANPQWAVCWNSDSCLEFDGSKDEPRWWWNCEWCRLKHARLQVEEEMDANA